MVYNTYQKCYSAKGHFYGVLEHHLLPFWPIHDGRHFNLMVLQDIRQRRCNSGLKRRTYTLLTDIAIFPNLNPKKNAWNLLINKVQEKQPLSIPKLKTTLWNVWVQMSNDYLIKLSDSMSNILRKVIEAKWQMIYQWFYGYHEINNIICFI